MIEVKKGRDLSNLAKKLRMSITKMAAELGYSSDAQIKKIIKDKPNDCIMLRLSLACDGLQYRILLK